MTFLVLGARLPERPEATLFAALAAKLPALGLDGEATADELLWDELRELGRECADVACW